MAKKKEIETRVNELLNELSPWDEIGHIEMVSAISKACEERFQEIEEKLDLLMRKKERNR